MGSAFSKQKVRILVVGLDNSGKTSILAWLKTSKKQQQQQQQQQNIAPTVGYNLETFEKHNLNFSFIDMSGQNQYRDMWEQYAQEIDGLIFVIDSVDKLRFSIMANELELLFNYDGIKHRTVPLLIYANKCDHKEAESSEFFIQYLKLQTLQNRSWYIVGSSAMTGEGLDQGLQWLSHKLQAIKKS